MYFLSRIEKIDNDLTFTLGLQNGCKMQKDQFLIEIYYYDNLEYPIYEDHLMLMAQFQSNEACCSKEVFLDSSFHENLLFE